MIFHSIIPFDVVFQDDNNDYYSRIIQYDGYQIEVMSTVNGPTHIKRLFSTSPKDYLNPKLQPGSIIELVK